MKRTDITALHDHTVAELQQQLAEVQKQLTKAKLELTVGKLENLRLPSQLQDDVARIKTVLRERKLFEEAQALLSSDGQDDVAEKQEAEE